MLTPDMKALTERVEALTDAYEDRLTRLVTEVDELRERVTVLENGGVVPPFDTGGSGETGEMTSVVWTKNHALITRSVDGEVTISGDVPIQTIKFVAHQPVRIPITVKVLTIQVGANVFTREL